MVAHTSRKNHKNHKNSQRRRRHQGGALTDVLPVTTWGAWADYPGALAWSPTTSAPPPLANGGLYTAPQSTGAWASSPFPATQYAEAVEAARVAQNPDVFFHQRPNDNTGASFSPYVAIPLSSQHYSAQVPGKMLGGKRLKRRNASTKRKNNNKSRRSK